MNRDGCFLVKCKREAKKSFSSTTLTVVINEKLIAKVNK